MKNNKKHRDQSNIDKILRGIQEISDCFSKPINSQNDLLIHLNDLYANGMRLTKYRMQIDRIRDSNEQVPLYKQEAIDHIYMILSIINDDINRVTQFLKENDI